MPSEHIKLEIATDKPCLAPLPDFAEPSFSVPPGAVDTHAHVIGDGIRFPYVAERSYTPTPADEASYLAMLDGTHMTHGVLIQVSVHGTDNRYMLEALRNHPDRLRGVAVVPPTVTDAELRTLHEAGVRGIRLNVLYGGGIGFDALESLAARIARLRWHIQIFMDVRNLPPLYDRLAKLPVTLVFDHMGHMPVACGLTHPGFQALRTGMIEHGWWVKLSGAYRISDDFDAYRDVVPWAQALVATAPQQLVWGSDWPHVAIPRMPNTGKLLNQLGDWAPDPETRTRILVTNPKKLYDFA